MIDGQALRLALDLFHIPSRVRMLRAEPLPADLTLLLRVAAGEESALAHAARIADRSGDTVRKAATFFIEQVLLCPEANSYRVLGTTSTASYSELRQHMALLMKWLHPDGDPDLERSLFVSRVTGAWDDLKTPERRAAYDRTHTFVPQSQQRRAGRRRMTPLARHPSPKAHVGFLRRALHFLFRGARP